MSQVNDFCFICCFNNARVDSVLLSRRIYAIAFTITRQGRLLIVFLGPRENGGKKKTIQYQYCATLKRFKLSKVFCLCFFTIMEVIRRDFCRTQSVWYLMPKYKSKQC